MLASASPAPPRALGVLWPGASAGQCCYRGLFQCWTRVHPSPHLYRHHRHCRAPSGAGERLGEAEPSHGFCRTQEERGEQMFRDLAPGAVGIKASFIEGLELAKGAGYEGVDLNVGEAARLAQEHSI